MMQAAKIIMLRIVLLFLFSNRDLNRNDNPRRIRLVIYGSGWKRVAKIIEVGINPMTRNVFLNLGVFLMAKKIIIIYRAKLIKRPSINATIKGRLINRLKLKIIAEGR